MVINVVLTKNISFIIPRSFYPDNAGGSRYQGCARSGIQASRHGDRKGRHYYTCVQRPGEPSYSSGDPCGRHGSYDLSELHHETVEGASMLAWSMSSNEVWRKPMA